MTATVTELRPGKAAVGDEPVADPAAEPQVETPPAAPPGNPADNGSAPAAPAKRPAAKKATPARKAPAKKAAAKTTGPTKGKAGGKADEPDDKVEALIVEIDKADLVNVVSSAARASASGSVNPAWRWLRLALRKDRLTVTGYDGDLAVTRHCKVTGGKATVAYVPADVAVSSAKACSNAKVTVEFAEHEVVVRSGPFECKITSSTSFDTWDQPPSPPAAARDAEVVKLASVPTATALGGVLHAASSDNARPLLCSIGVDTVGDRPLLWATDSYRLAVAPAPEGWPDVVFPVRVMKELASFAGAGLADEIELRLGDNYAQFTIGPVTMQCSPLEASGVDWRPLAAGSHPGPQRFRVNRQALAESVRRVTVVGSELVRLGISRKGQLISELRANGSVDASDPVTVTFVGVDDAKAKPFDLVVGFNPALVGAALGAFDNDEVELRFTDALKPVTIHEGDIEHRFELLMPVRM